MRRKLATYSLVLDHDVGGPKAHRFREVLGITLEHVDYLAAEIRLGVRQVPVSRVHENPPYGVGCQVVVPVRGVGIHQGHVMPVTTGWELRYVGDRPRLVSAYIKGRRPQ